ncbi:MAG: M23 family metallopeptidase [Mariprofundus sp.]
MAYGCRRRGGGWRVCPVVAVAARCCCLLMVLLLSACFSTSAHHGPARSAHHGSHKSVVYHVRSSDTLYAIGKRFGTDYHTIARRNHIHAPYRIYVGQRLYINRTAPRTHQQVVREIKHASKRRTVKRHKVSKKHKPVAHKRAVSYKKGSLLWPVKGVITSRFGRRGSRMHDGIDIGARDGTAVHASAAGEVVYSDSRLSGYGKLIIIRHKNNLFTAYAHNQRNLVARGARVRAGDVIARVGHTGRATGPHLHFEVRQGSTPVDPLAYLPH